MKASIRGLIITAAFIGPGTITTASVAGATLGYQLVWALVFSIVATCILQLMAKRLGETSGLSLSAAAMQLSQNKAINGAIAILIIGAIGVGNATYQGGNITGAALGLSSIIGGELRTWALSLGVLASIILITRKHQLVEKTLVGLVVTMSIVFISVMIIADTDWSAMLNGINPLNTDFSDLSLAIALIGTTIVPYNLYLQSGMEASTASQQTLKKQKDDWQLFASIGVGGLITLAILSSAATAFFATGLTLDSGNIANQLQPLLGDYAGAFFAIGLFAAGISSALTAPLASGYAIAGLFNWQPHLNDKRFLYTALVVLVVGTLLASFGLKPLALIVTAQITNAFLLPLSVIILLVACNNHLIMRGTKNSLLLNLLGTIVLMLVTGLSVYKLAF